jgi:signal transduction histidine kinase
MDLHQLEAGEWGLRTTSVGIGDLLLRAIQPYRALAEQKGIVLKIDAEDHGETRIRCDANRLGQVLTHLVENAVRHTAEGTVILRASLLPTGDWNHTRLVLSVEDTGQGLADELEGRPFEPFIAHEGGVGLGLAIVRGLARLMSATVTHESREGGGTAFRFSMEAALEDPAHVVADSR